MEKKYIVRLSDEERHELTKIIKKLSGTSQKVRRAQILLKADVDGPAWTDVWIAEAFNCRTKTVENIRQRLVQNGFRETLDGKYAKNRRLPNCWTESKKQGLLRSDWVHRLKALPMVVAFTGSQSCRVGMSLRSVQRPSAVC